jgi:hypothetical protein
LGRYLGRVDTKDDERGFDNMSDRPIKINEWQSYTVEGTIANSKSLSFEVYVFTMVNSILIKSNYLLRTIKEY